MARSKKPRNKPYRPKYAHNPVAAFEVLQKSQVVGEVLRNYHVQLNESDRQKIAISYGISLDRLCKGEGSYEDMGNLGLMCNVSIVLCERDIGKEYEQDVVQAQLALWRAHQRKEGGKNLGLDAVGLQALRFAFDLHGKQVEVAGQGQLIAAESEVARRMAAGDVFRTEEVETREPLAA
jgi:hypothetical protein